MGVLSRLRNKLKVLSSPDQPARPASQPAGGGAWEPEAPPESPRGDTDPEAYIDGLVKSNRVVLFMKGNPGSPSCGFSARAVSILQSHGAEIAHVDVLIDDEVRQAVKDYSSWPTIPQVYVGGQFLGGSDILAQMHESGELEELLKAPEA